MKQMEMQDAVWSLPPNLAAGPARKTESRYWLRPQVAGILGSLLLHSLLIQGLVLGSKPSKLPVKQGIGSIATLGEQTPESPLILLRLADSQIEDASLDQQFSSKGSAPKNLPLIMLGIDPAPALVNVPDTPDDKESNASIATADPERHARLFGIYTNQVHARIESHWRRPRSPVNGDADKPDVLDQTFRCQVAVIQDSQGKIQEIDLPDCNGSVAWQRSLVEAIQGASPLPAPPDRSVFSQTMTLDFVGYPFSAGASADEYQILSYSTASNIPKR